VAAHLPTTSDPQGLPGARRVSAVAVQPAVTASDVLDRVLFGYRYPFAVALVLSLAARVLAVVHPLYSTDGFAFAYDRAGLTSLLLQQGRFVQAAVEWLGDRIGFSGPDVRVAALLLAIALYAHAGLLFARVIADRPTAGAMTLFLALFTLHPFSIELFWFSETTLQMVSSIWLGAVGLYVAVLMDRPVRAGLLGITLIVMALAMYQTVMAYLLGAGALALAAHVALVHRDGAGIRGLLGSRAVRGVVVLMMSVPTYLAAVRLVSALTGVGTDARVSIGTMFADPGQELVAVARAVRTALWPWPDAAFVPVAASLILLLVLIVSAAVVASVPLRHRRPWAALICLGLIVGALICAAGLPQLGDSDWLAPRTVVAVSVVTAGTVMLAWDAVRLRALHAAMASAVALLCLSYVGTANRVLSDQRLVNTWDAQLVARIVSRLESEPQWSETEALAVVSTSWPYSAELGTRFTDINASALNKPWARAGLVEQSSGHRLLNATEVEARSAEEYCASVDPWPAPESAILMGRLAVVCLP
jgi:hypothetical protein